MNYQKEMEILLSNLSYWLHNFNLWNGHSSMVLLNSSKNSGLLFYADWWKFYILHGERKTSFIIGFL
ncbi:hypothetical protein BK120_32120 [Paenibacillus sp. FSL A5-0031]|nr:hypothetical protein BK120_32120 [Paenibacillus sp. FSL A5-0031]